MTRGGARKGAGRPEGQGKYGVETKPIRVPINKVKEVLEYIVNGISYSSSTSGSALMSCPLYSSSVSAGIPLSADEYIESMLDLNQYLICNPSATFFVRVSGDSMIGAGIYSDDILVVDRNIEFKHGKIVIAAIDGQLTVKRLHKVANDVMLKSENPEYADIEIYEGSAVTIWGVVTSVIHKV
jgi:DNA polymerase V